MRSEDIIIAGKMDTVDAIMFSSIADLGSRMNKLEKMNRSLIRRNRTGKLMIAGLAILCVEIIYDNIKISERVENKIKKG